MHSIESFLMECRSMNVTSPTTHHIPQSAAQSFPIKQPTDSGPTPTTPAAPTLPSNPSHLGNSIDTTA
jgi:hypothetical protein